MDSLQIQLDYTKSIALLNTLCTALYETNHAAWWKLDNVRDYLKRQQREEWKAAYDSPDLAGVQ